MDRVNVGVEAISWINIAAGMTIAGVAWYETTEFNAAFYSGLFAGLLLVLAGAWTAYDGARNAGRRSSWVSAICIVVGAWIFAYPWFVNLSNLYFWASVIIGGAVALASAYEVYAATTVRRTTPQRPVT